MNRAPRIRGNIKRLLLIGSGTVLGTMALIVLWVSATEVTSDWSAVGVYAALAAGSIICFAVIPSFVVWYLAAGLLVQLGVSSRWIPAASSAMTAVVGAIVITLAFAAFDNSIAGWYGVGIGAALSAISACVAVVLTLLLFPTSTGPSN